MARRSTYFFFFLFLAFCWQLAACSRESPSAPTQHDFAAVRTFPYSSTKERIENLRANGRSIELGFDKEQVARLVGPPDYQVVFFDPGEWLKKYFTKREFSWTYVYFAEYPFGMSDPDAFLEIFFDEEGRVSDVIEKESGRGEPSKIK